MQAMGFLEQIGQIRKALWHYSQAKKLVIVSVLMIGVIAATAYMQVLLNAWNAPFYNAISHKNIEVFIQEIGHFAVLAVILLLLNVGQTWLTQTIKLKLREGLMEDLLSNWLAPLRAYRLSHAGEIGANPDQRLSDDTTQLTQMTTDLAIGLLQAVLLLFSFIGVLWSLSSNVSFDIGGHTIVIPGFMVWCALLYSSLASFLSWLVGRPLIELNAQRFAREADLRFALMHVNEEIDAVTLHNGESDEKLRLNAIFGTVVAAAHRVISALTRLTWITSGYGWFTIVAPLIVAAPIYFRGTMSFGQLMVVVGAFNQVQSSLRWFVDNFSMIADWRATLLRVAAFRKAVISMDSIATKESEITFVEDSNLSLKIDELAIQAPIGNITLDDNHVVLKPDERIHIVGDSGASKTLLFHTIAGLWPWGSGRMSHPERDTMMFIAPRTYVPPGTLRSAILYPATDRKFEDADIVKALKDVGLDNFVGELDTVDRWDKRLNDDEKQCLAFARVMLKKPVWVILDDAWDVLDPSSSKRIHELFLGELKNIAIVNIGHATTNNVFNARELRAMTDPTGITSHSIGQPGKLVQPPAQAPRT